MKKNFKPDQLKSYFLAEKPLLFGIILTGTICSLFMVMINVMQGRLLDALLDHDSFQDLMMAALYFVGTVAFIQILRLLKRYFTRRFANKTTQRMRSIMMGQLIQEELPTLEKTQSGDMITRILSDVELCSEGMRKVMTEVFDTGMLIISYFFGMLAYDTKLSFIALISIPIASFLATMMKRFVEKKNQMAREANSKWANITLSQVEHVLLYRQNSVEKQQLLEYEMAQKDLKNKAIVAGVLENALAPFYEILSMIGILPVIILGGQYVMEGYWTIGDLTAYISIFVLLAQKASKAAKIFNITQKASVSWKRVKKYMQPEVIKPEVLSCAYTSVMRVEHLSFTYPESDKKIIEDVSFEIKKGEIMGICSPIAGGKSTLLLALLGKYPYEGKILFDGHDLHDIHAENLMGYMGHEAYLMSDTIEENIEMGRVGNLEDALKDACFDEDLINMPLKEKTQAGSEGSALSNGQKQRIALARALYSKTNFVLLDDPFSALDANTSLKVMENLKEHHKDQGILITTHKMELMKNFDKILYLEGDGHWQLGTHDELMRISAGYAKLARGGE